MPAQAIASLDNRSWMYGQAPERTGHSLSRAVPAIALVPPYSCKADAHSIWSSLRLINAWRDVLNPGYPYCVNSASSQPGQIPAKVPEHIPGFKKKTALLCPHCAHVALNVHLSAQTKKVEFEWQKKGRRGYCERWDRIDVFGEKTEMIRTKEW